MTQSETLDILKLGKNVFLTGAPGAGKTYVLNQYIAFLQSHNVDAAVTAYTGIAASHVNGRTLHSWAGLSFGALTPEQERERVGANKFLTEKIKRAKVLIIDEISMLHPEEFDRVNFICQVARGSVAPFGGLQLICCGDFFQIPPVGGGAVAANDPSAEQFVIDCASWKQAGMTVCYLHEQHRQGDAQLLKILDEIRAGAVSATSMKLLEGRLKAKVKAPIGIARLYTHNENVDAINSGELNRLGTLAVIYEVVQRGQAPLIEKLRKDYKVDKLILKVGARVMFTRNNLANGYANGTLGEVVEFIHSEDASTHEPVPVVLTFDKKRIIVTRDEWELEENGRVRATIKQMPLKLAWAITVHKSQGMTLDAAEIDLSRAFDKGMGYVALSRVKRLENISLLGLNETALQVSERMKVLDADFLESSEDAEALLAGMSKDQLEREQAEFLAAITRKPGGVLTSAAGTSVTTHANDELHYEPDELPVIDFDF